MSKEKSEIQKFLKTGKTHHDMDLRSMAIRDLTKKIGEMEVIGSELQEMIRVDLLELLTDEKAVEKSDVGEATVQLLSETIRKFDTSKVAELVTGLVKAFTDEELNEKTRDILQTSLKKSMRELPEDQGGDSAANIVFYLSKGIEAKETELQLMCMDMLSDALGRFGWMQRMKEHHENLVRRLREKLEPNEDEPDVPTQAADTIGVLARTLDEKTFEGLVDFLIERIRKTDGDGANAVPYVYAVGVMSREAGVKMGRCLEKILPILDSLCTPESFRAASTDGAANFIPLWEKCLLTFENIVKNCSDSLGERINGVLKVAVAASTYNPNQAVPDAKADNAGGEDDAAAGDDGGGDDWGDDAQDGEEKGWGNEDDDDDGWGAEGDQGGWGGGSNGAGVTFIDEEDLSWTIRSQATGVLMAVVSTMRKSLSKQFPSAVFPSGLAGLVGAENFPESMSLSKLLQLFLISRMDESNEAVNIRVLQCMKKLLEISVDIDDEDLSGIHAATRASSLSPPRLIRQNSVDQPFIEDVLRKISASYATASENIKKALNEVIECMVVAQRVNFGKVMFANRKFPEILSAVIKAAGSQSDNDLRTSSFRLLSVMMRAFPDPDSFENKLKDLVEAISNGIDAANLQVKSEALYAAGAVAPCINVDLFSNAKYVSTIFNKVRRILDVKDADAGVKNSAMKAIGRIVPRFANKRSGKDFLDAKAVVEVLPVIMERMNMPETHFEALVVLKNISNAIDMSASIESLISKILGLLTANASDAVKVQTFDTAVELINGNAGSIRNWDTYLRKVGAWISIDDTLLCRSVLTMVDVIFAKCSSNTVDKKIADGILDKMLNLVRSDKLQGLVLLSLSGAFGTLSKTYGFEELLKRLRQVSMGEGSSMQSVSSAARCIAAMARDTDAKILEKYVSDSLKTAVDAVSQQQISPSARLAFLSIGEIGLSCDLPRSQNITEQLVSTFQSPSAELRMSAAIALGKLTAGNMEQNMKSLLDRLRAQNSPTYLLLTSIREMVFCLRGKIEAAATAAIAETIQKQITSYTNDILKVLMDNAGSEMDGVRVTVAYCLGGLAQIDAKTVLSSVVKNLVAKSALCRATMVSSLRFAITPANAKVITGYVEDFMKMLRDQDIGVREQAVMTVTALLKKSYKFSFENPKLPDDELMLLSKSASVYFFKNVPPALYAETTRDEKYVTIQDMGKFKLIDDRHYPLRVACYRALGTITQLCAAKLDMGEFLKHIIMGVGDEKSDIVTLAWKNLYQLTRKEYVSPALGQLDAVTSAKPIFTGQRLKAEKVALKFAVAKLKRLKVFLDSSAKTEEMTKEQEEEMASFRAGLKALVAITDLRQVQLSSPNFCKSVNRIKVTKMIARLIREVSDEIAQDKRNARRRALRSR